MIRLGNAAVVTSNGTKFRPGTYDLRQILLSKVKHGSAR